MHYINAVFVAALALVAPAAATPQSDDRPACISDCADEFPTSSWCDGDETGEDLANCTCDTLRGSSLLGCFLECSPEDQGEYAQIIKGDCRDDLFPDAIIPEGDDGKDDDDDSDATTGSGSSEPTSTDEEAQPSQTQEEEEDGAMALGVPAALAAGGLFAALLL